MAASFDPTLPTAKDRVRFFLGDVGTTEGEFAFLITDELIGGVLGLRGVSGSETSVTDPEEILSAADLADELGVQFARLPDKTNLSLKLSNSQLSEQYKDCARRLRARGGQFVGEDGAIQIAAEVFAGGLTISGKIGLSTDADAVQPDFAKGQFDHPEGDTFNNNTDDGLLG